MNLDTLADFIQMGGYGGYVWSAYGLTFVVLACSYGYARWRFRKSRAVASLGAQEEIHVAARTVIFKELGPCGSQREVS